VNSHDDPLIRAIATLPPVLPDDTASGELRARCRARLERPRRLTSVTTVEPATIGAVCAIYAWQIARLVVP
jgi:hypothetical protein